uniref:Rho GTPase-activating protein 26 n=1 Tax=Pristionchus pacificus TaxID=54126 RepID=A0A8R1YCM9_PRIPA
MSVWSALCNGTTEKRVRGKEIDLFLSFFSFSVSSCSPRAPSFHNFTGDAIVLFLSPCHLFTTINTILIQLSSFHPGGPFEMVLKPLEFSDCISDSPWFRQNLHDHEQVLDDAYKNIKLIEAQCRELINCNKKLSQAQLAFAKSLSNFQLETVGMNQTDDERMIATCFGEFGQILVQIEEHREKMISQAETSYLEPIRNFRMNVIGKTLHEEKKKYEKESSKFYASLDKHLHLSTMRKTDDDFREADAQLEMQQHNFCQASLQYVEEVQNVQERMKFEFVETMVNFIYSSLSFFYVGYVVHEDTKPLIDNVKVHLQKACESFKTTQSEAEELKKKILKTHTKAGSGTSEESDRSTRWTIKQGYMYIQEKSKIPKTLTRDVLKGTWSKYYCVYSKETRIFTMIAVNAPTKTDMKSAVGQSSSWKLKDCMTKSCDAIDKRFCLDIVVDGKNEVITLQALSEEDRRQWIEAMDGKHEKVLSSCGKGPSECLQTQLDEIGFDFVKKCIRFIEDEGMREQGIYRNCGVNSKVKKMMGVGLERRKVNESKSWMDESEWETKTVSSAFKTYLRNLPEPLMTFDLHSYFISAAKMDDRKERVEHIHYYVYRLPKEHKEMLEMVIRHLRRVADSSEENLMTVGNLGVCFGPTLLRPREETVAAIMDIKFCNVVVEVLIAHSDEIFDNGPPSSIGSIKNEIVKEKNIVNEGRIEESKEEKKEEKREENEKERMEVIGRRDETIIVAERPDRLKEKSRIFPTMNSFEKEDRRIKRSAHVDGERPRRQNHGSSMEDARVREEDDDLIQRENQPGVYSFPASTSSVNDVNRPSNRYLPASCIHPQQLAASRMINQRPTIPPPLVRQAHSTSRGGREGGGGTMTSPPQSTVHSTNQPLYAVIKPCTSRADPPSISRVRTLYTCTPDHESELSFEAGQIITDVISSSEEGWLIGTLDGRTGLIPANYVEHL